MFGLDVKADLKEVTKYLTRVQKKQIPFATSQALNDTAFDSRKELQKQAQKKMKSPTRFTANAFQVIKSKKRELIAVVYVEGKRYEYLIDIIEGKSKTHKHKGYALPVNVRLNKFGNIPGKRRGLVKNKRQFIGTINGVSGVWERYNKGRNVKLMIAFGKTVEHKQRFHFTKIVKGIVNSKFKKNFNKRMTRALATAY